MVLRCGRESEGGCCPPMSEAHPVPQRPGRGDWGPGVSSTAIARGGPRERGIYSRFYCLFITLEPSPTSQNNCRGILLNDISGFDTLIVDYLLTPSSDVGGVPTLANTAP